MIQFILLTEKHPSVKIYYDFLKDNFKESTYFKGGLEYTEVEDKYVALVKMEKYIPFTYVVISSLGVFGSLLMYFFHVAQGLSVWIGVPAVLALAAYWILQSTLFYYFIVYRGLRKYGYKGVVAMRFS